MIKICLCKVDYKCQLCRQETIFDKIRNIKAKLNELPFNSRNIPKSFIDELKDIRRNNKKK